MEVSETILQLCCVPMEKFQCPVSFLKYVTKFRFSSFVHFFSIIIELNYLSHFSVGAMCVQNGSHVAWKRPKYRLKAQVANTSGHRSRPGFASQLSPSSIFRTGITDYSILYSSACSQSGSVLSVPSCISRSVIRYFSASHRSWLSSGVSYATSCACNRASSLADRCAGRVSAEDTPRRMCAWRLYLTERRCRAEGERLLPIFRFFSTVFQFESTGAWRIQT